MHDYRLSPLTRSHDSHIVLMGGMKLTFRHRASCILGQAFHCSPENAFYIQGGSNMTGTVYTCLHTN